MYLWKVRIDGRSVPASAPSARAAVRKAARVLPLQAGELISATCEIGYARFRVSPSGRLVEIATYG